MALKLGAALNQQIVVDNRGGGSTIIGMELLAKAVPDGYTLGFPTNNLPERLTGLGVDVAASSTGEFGAFIRWDDREM